MKFGYTVQRKRLAVLLAIAGLGGCARIAPSKGPRLKEDGPGPQNASEYARFT
jgi:hypothetical protein